jgi:DNA-binding Lrp family transcriptional regulator
VSYVFQSAAQWETKDFMLKILVKDMESYQDFVMNKLSTIENIGNNL